MVFGSESDSRRAGSPSEDVDGVDRQQAPFRRLLETGIIVRPLRGDTWDRCEKGNLSTVLVRVHSATVIKGRGGDNACIYNFVHTVS